MNMSRRRRVADALELIARAAEILDECGDEEREAYDALPEGLQCAERGELMDEAAGALTDAAETLDEMQGELYELCGIDLIPVRRRRS